MNTRMCRFAILLAFCAALLLESQTVRSSAAHSYPHNVDYLSFKNPAAEFRPRAMWGYNLSNVTEAKVISGVSDLAHQGYGGFLVTVDGANGSHLDPAYFKQAKSFFGLTDHGVEYMSDTFFHLYRTAIEQGKQDGLSSFVLYDDYNYPTGNLCGELYAKYPQYMAKRLDMVEDNVTGPDKIDLAIPAGIYVGAVAMNLATFERTDISDRRTGSGRLQYQVPRGKWKVMMFYLNTTAVLKIRNPGLVDYLDDDAMNMFLKLSYQRFYDHFKQDFGNFIKMSFYDEPSMHWLDGRMWTPSFNRKFQQQHGYSPMKDYPALWYDIGPDTEAARNALFGFRAQLFAENFVGKISRWCQQHGIQSSGHLDQEEIANPVPINGDLMKVFAHQDIPGHDDIFYLGRANRGYKVVTSAAFNYDKPVVMAETYAAYRKIDENMLFRVAMDQFAMGISLQIPAAESVQRANDVPRFNEYVARLSYMLRHGRHVADVAVLYPIASLQGCYRFSSQAIPEDPRRDDAGVKALYNLQGAAWKYAYLGGIVPPEIDYMDIGETLFRGLRIDYTYLHPEVLSQRCLVSGNKLILNNSENREEYRVLIVPGGNTISLAAARKIGEFYRSGGTVIATSKLPYLSAELHHDGDVQQIIGGMFHLTAGELAAGKVPIDRDKGYFLASNHAGGRAFFLPKAEAGVLNAVLRQAVPVRDVDIHEAIWPQKSGSDYDGALTYIHKVRGGKDIYFFANSSPRNMSTDVMLRGVKDLVMWNPDTGAQKETATRHAKTGGESVSAIRLSLAPFTSTFYVGKPSPAGRSN